MRIDKIDLPVVLTTGSGDLLVFLVKQRWVGGRRVRLDAKEGKGSRGGKGSN